MRNLHQFLQDSFRYYSYTCPWKLSHSLKWILYGYFFQARIRPLIVYLQNVVKFNTAREIQNRAVSAFSQLPRGEDKCSKPEARRSNSLLFPFTLLQKNYNRDKAGPTFLTVLHKSYHASSLTFPTHSTSSYDRLSPALPMSYNHIGQYYSSAKHLQLWKEQTIQLQLSHAIF